MITKTYNRDYSDQNYKKIQDNDEHVLLPEITVYPDNLLLKQIRLAYPNKVFRQKILNYLYDETYRNTDDDRYASDHFYPSDVPIKRLLDVHSKANYPNIANSRHTWIPDFILRRDEGLYDDASTPDKKWYRGGYRPLLNTIYIDYALPQESLFKNLLAEYAHGINAYNLPDYLHIGPGILTHLNRHKYDETQYGVPGTEEYYTHDYTHRDNSVELYLRKFLRPTTIAEEPSRTKLNLADLSKALHINIKETPPSKDFNEFWKKYHKLQPNDGIGGGGEW